MVINEDILKDDTELKRVKQLEKDISTIESKKSKLTDLLIDGKIEQEDYDEKKLSFQRKLHQITEEKAYLEENIGQQKNISRRMSQLRQTLENENVTEKMCSSDGNVVGEMCSPADTDTRGVRNTAPKEKYLKLLEL